MQIDLFWIVLAVIFYIFLFMLIYFDRKKIKYIRTDLQTVKHQKSEIGNFMSIFCRHLEIAQGIDESMRQTAKYVADLIGAQSLCIFIVDDDDFLTASGIHGDFPPLHKVHEHVLTKPRYLLTSLQKEKVRVGEGIIGKVGQTGEPILVEDAATNEILANSPVFVETIMAVPMMKEGSVIGVICAVNNIHNGPFMPEQFSTLRFMSDQVVLAYNIVTVYATLSEQQRINQELAFARQLQSSLLPDCAPRWEPFVIEAFSKPAKEVSGDFYDFVEIDNDRLLVVIGDACGKGVPACMLMAMTRSFIRAGVERFTTLHDLMQDLNNDLFRDTGDERFVTVSCCLLNSKSKTVEFARAGHTELLISRKGHPIRAIFPNGSALGLLPSDMVENCDLLTFAFLDHMSLLLFSDGITEALNKADEEFGVDALLKIFKENEAAPPDKLIESILTEVNKFSEGTLQADDQTMVIISHS